MLKLALPSTLKLKLGVLYLAAVPCELPSHAYDRPLEPLPLSPIFTHIQYRGLRDGIVYAFIRSASGCPASHAA